MIIMRRIIAGLATLALTACVETETARPTTDAAPAATASPPATTPLPGTAQQPATPSAAAAPAARPVAQLRTVLFVGTSLTAGYGVGDDVAWPAVIQQRIDSAGLPYRVVNAGISGETSAGGLRRIDWSLQQPADVLVLELGANDALRGLDPAQMERNLDEILTRARTAWPGIALVLIGMEAPPNLGPRYVQQFRRVFVDLAERHDAALVPFLLQDVAAVRSLNIADGIHPNIEGHRILARNVWPTLEPVLRRRAAQPPARASAG
jgi:acyl-CoA thioesterase I